MLLLTAMSASILLGNCKLCKYSDGSYGRCQLCLLMSSMISCPWYIPALLQCLRLRDCFKLGLDVLFYTCRDGESRCDFFDPPELPILQGIKMFDNDSAIKNYLRSSKKPVVVEVATKSCGACERFAATYAQLQKRYKGSFNFAVLDAEDSEVQGGVFADQLLALAEKPAVPCFFLIPGGEASVKKAKLIGWSHQLQAGLERH